MVAILHFSTGDGSRTEATPVYSTEVPVGLTGDLVGPCDGCFACNHWEVSGSGDPVAAVGHRWPDGVGDRNCSGEVGAMIDGAEPVCPPRGTPGRFRGPGPGTGTTVSGRKGVRPAPWTGGAGTGRGPSAVRSRRFPELSKVFLEMPCAVRHGESEAMGRAGQYVFQAGVCGR